jgi:hypothetical protein
MSVIEAISSEKGRERFTLLEYVELFDEFCPCGKREGDDARICFCQDEESLSRHLCRLEEGLLGRVRIIDRKTYQRDLKKLSRKRPVLARHRERQEKEVPF